MKCVICKTGETQTGQTTVTLERNQMTLVFKAVPAEVCEDCGEAYINDAISGKLLESAEAAVYAGILVDVRKFAA